MMLTSASTPKRESSMKSRKGMSESGPIYQDRGDRRKDGACESKRRKDKDDN